MIAVGFVFLLGTAGSMEMSKISNGQAALQVLLSLIVMGAALFGWRVLRVKERRMRKNLSVKQRTLSPFSVAYAAPQEEKVC